jgi:hypothetical protein
MVLHIYAFNYLEDCRGNTFNKIIMLSTIETVY